MSHICEYCNHEFGGKNDLTRHLKKKNGCIPIDKIIEKAAADSATQGAETNKKDQNFKGPEGFSNVIGVGPNPVLEAMNLQLEEAQKQTALLEKIASPEGGVPKDFTKDTK